MIRVSGAPATKFGSKNKEYIMRLLKMSNISYYLSQDNCLPPYQMRLNKDIPKVKVCKGSFPSPFITS